MNGHPGAATPRTESGLQAIRAHLVDKHADWLHDPGPVNGNGQGMTDADRDALEVLGEATPAFTLAYLRACDDCVLLANPEGRVTFISENGRRALEAAGIGALVGRDWWDLWPDDLRAQMRESFARAKAGGLVRFTAAMPTRTGAPRDWDTTIAPLVNAEGRTESLLVIMRDATG